MYLVFDHFKIKTKTLKLEHPKIMSYVKEHSSLESQLRFNSSYESLDYTFLIPNVRVKQ